MYQSIFEFICFDYLTIYIVTLDLDYNYGYTLDTVIIMFSLVHVRKQIFCE
jgi:hypothetical protein